MSKILNVITLEKLEKYSNITKKALDKIKFCNPDKTHLDSITKDYYNMAKTYYDDSIHFKKNGDYINAFAALNYAHGWLDAGARLGLFDVDHDNVLFTVD
jgi:uncharacterized protein